MPAERLIHPPHLDRETGAIRLERPTFEAAVAHALRQDAPALHQHFEALEDVGLLRGEALHEDLAACLQPVLGPVCRLSLWHGSSRSEGWVSSPSATLLVPAEGQLWDLIRMHASFLPEALARMAGLGPRRVDAEAGDLILPLRRLEALLDGSAREDNEIRELGTVRAAWGVACSWDASATSNGKRALEVLDSVRGLWLVNRTQENVSLQAATSRTVWRELTGLLPRDDELAPTRAEFASHPVDDVVWGVEDTSAQ